MGTLPTGINTHCLGTPDPYTMEQWEQQQETGNKDKIQNN